MGGAKVRSEFIKNVLTLITGTTVAQLIPVLISPILTRLYSPDDFAIWTIYISIFSILEIIGTGRFEYAILLPKYPKESANLGALVLIFNVGLILLVSVLLLFWVNNFTGIFQQELSATILWMLPVGLMFYGFNQLGYFWLNKEKNYRFMAYLKVTRGAAAGFFQLFFGFLKFGGVGLVFANVITLFSLMLFTLKLTISDFFENRKLVTFKGIKHAFARRKEFPMVNMFHALSDKVNGNGTNLIMGYYYPSWYLGFYGLTQRVIRTPVQFVGVAISEVFYQRVSEKFNQGKYIYPLVKKVAFTLAMAGLPVFTGLYFFAPFVMGLVFGNKWHIAGEYASILCPWMWLNFIVNPLSTIPMVLNKQKVFFALCFAGNSLGVLVFLMGGMFIPKIEITLRLFSGVMSLYMLVLIVWFMVISKKSQKNF